MNGTMTSELKSKYVNRLVASESYGCTVRGKRRHDHVGVSTASADALE